MWSCTGIQAQAVHHRCLPRRGTRSQKDIHGMTLLLERPKSGKTKYIVEGGCMCKWETLTRQAREAPMSVGIFQPRMNNRTPWGSLKDGYQGLRPRLLKLVSLGCRITGKVWGFFFFLSFLRGRWRGFYCETRVENWYPKEEGEACFCFMP